MDTLLQYSLTDAASSTIEDLQLSPHRVEFGYKLSLERVPIGVGSNGIEVDLVDHVVEEVANLIQVSFDGEIEQKGGHTGRGCHLPPPISNHERCPPSEVVRSTA